MSQVSKLSSSQMAMAKNEVAVWQLESWISYRANKGSNFSSRIISESAYSGDDNVAFQLTNLLDLTVGKSSLANTYPINFIVPITAKL